MIITPTYLQAHVVFILYIYMYVYMLVFGKIRLKHRNFAVHIYNTAVHVI